MTKINLDPSSIEVSNEWTRSRCCHFREVSLLQTTDSSIIGRRYIVSNLLIDWSINHFSPALFVSLFSFRLSTSFDFVSSLTKTFPFIFLLVIRHLWIPCLPLYWIPIFFFYFTFLVFVFRVCLFRISSPSPPPLLFVRLFISLVLADCYR